MEVMEVVMEAVMGAVGVGCRRPGQETDVNDVLVVSSVEYLNEFVPSQECQCVFIGSRRGSQWLNVVEFVASFFIVSVIL